MQSKKESKNISNIFSLAIDCLDNILWIFFLSILILVSANGMLNVMLRYLDFVIVCICVCV